MIYEKSAWEAPAFVRRSVRKKFALFAEKSGALTVSGLHVRAEGDALVCAEGAEEIGTAPPGGTFVPVEGGSGVFFFAGGKLVAEEGAAIEIPEPPKRILVAPDREGEEKTFLFGERGLYAFPEMKKICDGGTCCARFGERLLRAKGNRVFWTRPLAPDDWDRAQEGGGWVDLPSSDGEILAMVPFRGEILLFRERGIERLETPGDVLSFRAEKIPYSYGALLPGSVRDCGSSVVFLTECGAFAFDGSRVERLKKSGYYEILPLSGAESAAADGKYYCLCALRATGERCVWCVDPERDEGCLLRYEAESLFGGDRLRFVCREKVFRLAGRDVPAGRGEFVLATERSLLGLSPGRKFLDGVLLEGRGRFCVEASGEGKAVCAVYARAGERCVFPVPVRGSAFSLRIACAERNAFLKSVAFDLREEGRTW